MRMVFHIELRQFPHNAWRFNLGDRELRAIVGAWVRGELLEVGERRWNPQQARLTIFEGPELALGQLTMGRGWRLAQKDGEDVTERVLVAARAAGAAAPASAATAAAAPAVSSDPLGLAVQLASLLGEEAGRLLDAWRAAAARSPELAPSESLAQAERELRSAG
jgi:hypothetical protein